MSSITPDIPVHWLIRAQDQVEEALSEWLCSRLAGCLGPQRLAYTARSAPPQCKEEAFARFAAGIEAQLRRTFPEAESIVVVEFLSGYRPKSALHILRIEVTSAPPDGTSVAEEGNPCDPTLRGRPRACIVKVAFPVSVETLCGIEMPPDIDADGRDEQDVRSGNAKLAAEMRGWLSCQRRGNDRGRIFMKLHPGVPPLGGLEAYDTIVYEDAHQVLRAAEVTTLEDAVIDACRWGRPPAESVEDAIAQIFYEMSDRFYRRSWSQQAGRSEAFEYWRDRIGPGLKRWLDNAASAGQCRQDVLCLLSAKEDEFLPPCPYIEDFERRDDPEEIPEMQRGCAHGDLHGRNILVGLIDGEAKWPAVFDYEDMRCDNYIGWDFVKLEFELKVRVLRHVLSGGDEEFTRGVYRFETELDRETEKRNNSGSWSRGHREKDWGRKEQNGVSDVDAREAAGQAEDRDAGEGATEAPPGLVGLPRGTTGLGALAGIILGIRRMARKCLETHRGRNRRWLDEYYFLLMSYGLYSEIGRAHV